MKKFLLAIGIIFGVGIGAIIFVVGLRLYSINSFAMDWEKRFLESKGDISQFPVVNLKTGMPEGALPPDPFKDAKLVKVDLPDGSWVVVAEHDVEDEGLEWDKAVFYDSRGDIRTTSFHFCSWEGLFIELSIYSKDAKNLDDFYKAAAGIKFEE